MIIASIVIYKHKQKDVMPTIESLLGIKAIDKIVLVDNSRDCDWADSLNDSRVDYLKSDGNYGFGYGHNLAIRKYGSQSKYFLICNPDIQFGESEFNKFLNFVKNQDEGLFLPKIVYENGENQYGARLLPSPLDLFARRFSPKLGEFLDRRYLLKDFDIDKPVFAPYLSGCFMLFKSQALINLGGFDERFFMYMEDVDLSRRCASKFGTLYYPYAQITHKHEKASSKNFQLFKEHIRSTIQYFNKWGWILDKEKIKLNNRSLRQFK